MKAVVEFNEEELRAVINALNETKGIDEWEYELRIGCSKATAIELLARLKKQKALLSGK